jgi:secreted protein with Ig-like and vWFA domain
MNTDDPKFTAYVLGELPPDEHEQVHHQIESDESLAVAADELRNFTESLRAELHGEPAEPLTLEQRAAILGESLSAPENVIVPNVAWWRSPWFVSAAAAVVISGFVSAICFQARHIERLTAERSAALKLAQNVQIAGANDEQTKARELADSTLSLVIPNGLAPTSDQAAAALREWYSQPGAIALKDMIASHTEPIPEAPASENTPTSSPLTTAGIPKLPAPDPEATRAPSTMAVAKAKRPKLAKTDGLNVRGRGIEVTRRGADGEIAEYTSASGTSSSTPSISAPRDRDKRLSSAERKVQKELNDLKGRLESLEKLQRRETREKTEDPVLKQTIEHVRRTLEALQAAQDGQSNTEAYDSITDNPFLTVKENQLSTFSVDVDTASYTNVRRFLESNQRPPKGAVRIEELLNYFRYDYPVPAGKDPFSCVTEVATCPWAPEHRLVRVGIKAREIPKNQRPPANLVFLVDVSGSMEPENKLPLVKDSLRVLTDQLGPEDSVAIAVYAGASGCVLEPTRDMDKVRAALDRLEAGGSTNGAAGIQLAYDLAQRGFKRGASNRVILCTDGDFNVGISDQSQLVSLIRDKAKTGIFLSVLGFGFGNLKDSTLEKLADKGNGTYGYIDSLTEGRRLFVEQLTGSLVTIAKDVKLQVEFNPARVAAYRLIGYENRLLAKEDFNDDQKDAGEIGAGHSVTALYEIVPAGREASVAPAVDDLKYGPHLVGEPDANPELLTVKVRYKQPEADVSTKLEFPLTDTGATWEKSTGDFRWAAAVAGFGMLLRESPHKGSLSWSLLEELATEGRATSPERTQFTRLIEKARALAR